MARPDAVLRPAHYPGLLAGVAMSEIDDLKDALRAFLCLSWTPDAAPGPSCYIVQPVAEARRALVKAGVLLDGASPFPTDINGSVTVYPGGKRGVWLDGRCYDETRRDLVPKHHLAVFDAALKKPMVP